MKRSRPTALRARLRSRLRVNQFWRSYRVGLLLFRTLYIINRERSRVVRARARGDEDARPNVAILVRILREFTRTAIDLGGLLIKLGQFLGARADMLPQEALEVLATLHDDVPPERFEDIEAVIAHEMDAPLGDLFRSVDPHPAGAASLGQVHRAVLKNGRVVALKIQRPGIGEIVQTDLRTLRFVLTVVRLLAPAADRFVDLRALYREFSRTVYEELDYLREGRNAEQFARIFADDPMVQAPDVLWEHTTRRVLVLEWVEGVKIADLATMENHGIDRDAVARQLAASYIRQVLEAGFFHADPHPGNIFVQSTPEGARLVFVDFGMMGTITPRMRAGLRDIFNGVMRQDAALVVHGMDTLNFLTAEADHDLIEQVIGRLLARFSSIRVGELRETDPRDVMQDLDTTLYDQPLRLPAEFAFFGRAAGMLLGLTVALSPSFNFVEVAAPYARQFMASNGLDGILRLLGIDNINTLGRDVLRDSVATVRSLAALPQRLERVLSRAERGELQILLDSRHLPARTRRGASRSLDFLTQPIPVWLPLGVAGAFFVHWLMHRVRPTGRGRARLR